MNTTEPGRQPGFSIQLKPAAAALVAPLLWGIVKDDPDLPAGTSFALFRLHLIAGYRFLGIYAGPALIGAVGYHGERMHLAVLPEWRGRWYSVRIGAQIVAYGFQKAARLLGYIRAGDKVTARLAGAMGFVLRDSGPWEVWQLAKPSPAP